jgi:hypothetical protein
LRRIDRRKKGKGTGKERDRERSNEQREVQMGKKESKAAGNKGK